MVRGVVYVCLLTVIAAIPGAGQDGAASEPVALHYRVSWRLMNAGNVELRLAGPIEVAHPEWSAVLALRSTGFVDSLYRVDNLYNVSFDDDFCAESYVYQVSEKSKWRRIEVDYQKPPGSASYREYDLRSEELVDEKHIDVPPCVHDELGALALLRTMSLEPGEAIELPISNGKKSVSARVEVQEREQVETPSGVYDTIRYEAFLYHDVLYRRKGRLFVWLTDDERRLPVQIRVKLGFFIGTVTLKLEKEDRLDTPSNSDRAGRSGGSGAGERTAIREGSHRAVYPLRPTG